jgi:hypothetical protein
MLALLVALSCSLEHGVNRIAGGFGQAGDLAMARVAVPAEGGVDGPGQVQHIDGGVHINIHIHVISFNEPVARDAGLY